MRNSVSCARIFRAVCAGSPRTIRRAKMPKLTATTATNEIRQASAAILAALRCDPSIALVVILFSPAAGDSLALERATATGAREFHLLPLALAGGWAEAAPFTPALAGLLAFFRRHLLPPLLPSLGHSPPKIETRRYTHTKVSEQNPAESEQSDSLPEGDLPP